MRTADTGTPVHPAQACTKPANAHKRQGTPSREQQQGRAHQVQRSRHPIIEWRGIPMLLRKQ